MQEQAVNRQIKLDAKKQEANEQFCAYMKSVGKQPYAVQAVVFWSIEQAYCQVCAAEQNSAHVFTSCIVTGCNAVICCRLGEMLCLLLRHTKSLQIDGVLTTSSITATS